jgi:Resolvase, N terminal domain/Recombinase zinc beta ribbon domain
MSKGAGDTAWALLVVSDPGQADTLPDQQAWAEQTAREKGWPITRTFSGVSSGKLGARGLTLRMIGELESLPPEQRPRRVLMIRLERLGRGDGLEAINAFVTLKTLGVVVHTRLDGDVSYGRASDLLAPVVRFVVGGMENEIRQDKLRAMYERLRKARMVDPSIAVCMRPPYGLVYESGRVVPKEPEATAVRLAYDLKGQGYGCHLIAKRLAQVAPPMTLKSGEARPQRWTSDRVRRLIHKDTYRDTLIDGMTWTRAQPPAREISRPTMRYQYPLGGALRCACGCALVGATGSRKRSNRFRYYQCRNMAAHNGRMKHYRGDRLEEQFAALLARLTAHRSLLEDYATTKQGEGHAEALAAQLSALKRELKGLDDRRRAVFTAFEDGTLLRDDLQWRLDDLKTREMELASQIEQVDREAALTRAKRLQVEDIRALVDSANLYWPVADIEDRRALAKAVANAFGGLTVTYDGSLTVADARARPRSHEQH